MTDRELEIIYVAGCVESQAVGLRRVFDAGVEEGKKAGRDNWHTPEVVTAPKGKRK